MTDEARSDFFYLMEVARRHPDDLADILAEVTPILTDRFENLAIAMEGVDPDRCLRTDRAHPGYLQVQDGSWSWHVPWVLAAAFPTLAVLARLAQLGRTVALPPVDEFCLSGSCVLLGRNVAVGDVDFCQYYPAPPSAMIAVVENCAPTPGNRVLVEGKYGRLRAKPNSSDWTRLREHMSKVTDIDSAERFMLQFVATLGDEDTACRVLPASTVVLATDFGDRARGAARSSFVFQEALCIADPATSRQPWPLADPVQFSHYLNFLHGQMLTYLDSQPIKALKRVVSFCASARMPDFYERGLDLLMCPEATRFVVARSEQEVRDFVQTLPSEERSTMLARLGEAGEDPSVASDDPGSDVEAWTGRCRDLVRECLRQIEVFRGEARSGGSDPDDRPDF